MSCVLWLVEEYCIGLWVFICMQYNRVIFFELCVVVNGEILHWIVGVHLYAVQ